MIKSLIARYTKDESGATAIEYGLIAGLLSIVIIAAVTAVGGGLTETFCSIGEALGADACEVPENG